MSNTLVLLVLMLPVLATAIDVSEWPMKSTMDDDEDSAIAEDGSGGEEATQPILKTPEPFEPVAFEMVLEKDIKGRKDLDKIKYDEVLLNSGGGLITDNIAFIAPRSGLYFLYAHVMVHNRDSLTLSIVHNVKSIAVGYTPHGIIYGVASITTAAFLNKDDVVYTTKEGSRSIRGGQWSRFGGVLIQSA